MRQALTLQAKDTYHSCAKRIHTVDGRNPAPVIYWVFLHPTWFARFPPSTVFSQPSYGGVISLSRKVPGTFFSYEE